MTRRRLLLAIAALAVAAAVTALPVGLTDDPVPRVVHDLGEQGLRTPPPDAPAVPAPAVPVVEQAPAAGNAGQAGQAESAADRAARVSRDAMVPHPRPPAQPDYAPGVRASMSAANASTINLGTLTPPPPRSGSAVSSVPPAP